MIKKKTPGLAIASLVMGIFSLYGLGSILAIIFGIISLNKIKKDKNLKGEGFAIAGIVLGIVGIIVLTISLTFFYVGESFTPVN